MTQRDFTLIDAGRERPIRARVEGDRVELTPGTLEAALGWRLEPRGLCRGDTCIPLGPAAGRLGPQGVDLAAFAERVDRPLALEAGEGLAVLGTSAARRAARMASREAPDFTLPDLEGRPHALSSLRGRKVLLLAWASW
jgi:hypothetical protein